MNTAFVLSRHGSFREISDKMGGDDSFMAELFAIRKYAEKSDRVFVFSHDRESFERLMPENCTHVRFHGPLLYTLFGWIVMLLYVARHGIRIVRVETVTGLLHALFVNRLTRAKVVLDYLYLWHQPMGDGVKKGFVRKLESFLLGFADYFIVANDDVGKFAEGRGKVLDIGANGVILDVFDKALPDTSISRLSGKKIIFVGRLIGIKDPLTLIRAYREVRKKRRDIHLIVCGDGELREECEKVADGSVVFLGFAKNVPSLLKASDVFILPSRFDASPRALVEAMAVGLPCIATRVGGVPGYLDGGCGVLVEPGNVGMLAEKMEYILSHGKEAGRLGRKARERVEEKYNLGKNLEKEIGFMMKETDA